MVAKNRSPRRRVIRPPTRETAAADTIDLFTQKMQAVQARDHALDAIARLRDAGQIRAAKTQLALAEQLHARIDAIDQEFAARRTPAAP